MRHSIGILMIIVTAMMLCVFSNYQVIESHSNTIDYLNNSVELLSQNDHASDEMQMNDYVLRANVVITDGRVYGSGVMVAPDMVLTAGHIVDINNIYVVDIDGNEYDIIRSWKSSKYDVGFIWLKGELPYLRLGEIPKLLDTVCAISAPYQIEFATTITKGVISHLDRDACGRVGLIQADAECAPGSSGGALLNTELEIIGICVCGPNPGGGVVLFEPVSHIEESLQEYLEN